jgi:hypothetical protein
MSYMKERVYLYTFQTNYDLTYLNVLGVIYCRYKTYTEKLIILKYLQYNSCDLSGSNITHNAKSSLTG